MLRPSAAANTDVILVTASTICSLLTSTSLQVPPKSSFADSMPGDNSSLTLTGDWTEGQSKAVDMGLESLSTRTMLVVCQWQNRKNMVNVPLYSQLFPCGESYQTNRPRVAESDLKVRPGSDL